MHNAGYEESEMKSYYLQPLQVTGFSLLILILALVFIGPLIVTHSPSETDFSSKLKPPTTEHLLGTDQLGRDVMARIIEGGKRSLGAVFLVTAGVMVISVFLGLAAAMLGGMTDHLITRTIDIILALPSLIFALAVVGVLGPGFWNLVFAMVISHWASSTRLVRSFVLASRNRPDILAAREAGLSDWRIVSGHLLPEVLSKLVVVMTLRLGDFIVSISGLSFLGLGVQPPDAEWGAMLSQSRLFFDSAPWLFIAPAGAILLTVIGANLVGESLRDMVDPNVQL